jgi:transcriptional regulator with XRE-family HTH domain
MKKLDGFGARLADLRKRSGLTQKEVAERTGINLRTYQTYEIEGREVSSAALFALDEAFNWNPRWILSGKDTPYGGDTFQIASQLLERIEQVQSSMAIALTVPKKIKVFDYLMSAIWQGRDVPDSEIKDLLVMSAE